MSNVKGVVNGQANDERKERNGENQNGEREGMKKRNQKINRHWKSRVLIRERGKAKNGGLHWEAEKKEPRESRG